MILAVMPPLLDADFIVAAALWIAVAFTVVTGLQYLVDGQSATSTTGD